MFKRRLTHNPGNLYTAEVREEAAHQLHFLRLVREGSSDDSVEFNRWITTRDGQGGWLGDL